MQLYWQIHRNFHRNLFLKGIYITLIVSSFSCFHTQYSIKIVIKIASLLTLVTPCKHFYFITTNHKVRCLKYFVENMDFVDHWVLLTLIQGPLQRHLIIWGIRLYPHLQMKETMIHLLQDLVPRGNINSDIFLVYFYYKYSTN